MHRPCMRLEDRDMDQNDYYRSNAFVEEREEDYCPTDSLLPRGIERVSVEAIASSRLITPEVIAHEGSPVTIAAFDFDGTCINGSSPKRLVSVLTKRKRINCYKLLRIALWGLAYKFNLPNKDAEGVRERVFSAFAGHSAVAVNRFLCDFYHDKVEPNYRMEADAEMVAHLEAGHVVVVVSASFEPIVASAMVEHPIQYALGSRMKIDSHGAYTDEVEGLPTEGADKLFALRKFADEMFGAGSWKLGFAYGDHYSDLTLLEAAEHPYAVTPDQKLARYARQHGWNIVEWD